MEKPRKAPLKRPRKQATRLRKPIALKLVAALVLLTAGASLWQGRRDFSLSRRRLERIKNRSGVRFVKQLALFVPPFWRNQPENGSPGATEARSKARKAVEKKLKELAKGEAGGDILDIVIFSPTEKDTFYASLKGEGAFVWQQGAKLDVPFAGKAGVHVFTGKKGSIPVRSFVTDMKRNGVPVGRIVVYLSAEDIKAAEQKLWYETVRNVIIGIVLATAISVLLGALLTRPIRALAHDMRAVSTGNLDRRSNVASADEVGDLARTFNNMVGSLKEVQERRSAQKAMEKELGIARGIQKSLLPEALPEFRTWEVAAHWTPAKEVGGDYYDFIPLHGESWGVAVADVSGKGVPASLIMSMTRCLLRLATRAGQGPADTVGLVDGVLSPDLKSGMFVSMVYLHLSEGSGEIQLVRAGHNPPIVINTRENRIELCKIPGAAIGMAASGQAQPCTEGKVSLGPDDLLVLYSDGVTEAMSEDKEEFGTKRFATALSKSKKLPPNQVVSNMVKQLEAWRGSAPQSDDITLVVLKRKT